MISLNAQPAEKPAPSRSDQAIEIVSCFETIQGEGPYVGTPSVFVRLAGCNLTCRFCDTDYTQNRRFLTPAQLLQEVKALRSDGLVVITGGEPFRQGIGPAADHLLRAGYIVQVETNGTLYPQDFPYGRIMIVCSPKTASLSSRIEPLIGAYKYVVEAGYTDPEDGLPLRVLGEICRVARPRPGFPRESVFVQPCDVQDPQKNNDNIQEAVSSCLKFGYRLCIQTHKLVGLD